MSPFDCGSTKKSKALVSPVLLYNIKNKFTPERYYST